jgi:ATP dependent DNA ligase domain
LPGRIRANDRNFEIARFAPDLVRHRRTNERILLFAFDLIELNGDDLPRDPLEGRKVTLEMILAKSGPGIRFNEHIEGDGETVFRHACKLGLEGIVSKRRDLPYRSGRSPDWLKMKNANAPAVKREAEEDWGPTSRFTMTSRRLRALPLALGVRHQLCGRVAFLGLCRIFDPKLLPKPR